MYLKDHAHDFHNSLLEGLVVAWGFIIVRGIWIYFEFVLDFFKIFFYKVFIYLFLSISIC